MKKRETFLYYTFISLPICLFCLDPFCSIEFYTLKHKIYLYLLIWVGVDGGDAAAAGKEVRGIAILYSFEYNNGYVCTYSTLL